MPKLMKIKESKDLTESEWMIVTEAIFSMGVLASLQARWDELPEGCPARERLEPWLEQSREHCARLCTEALSIINLSSITTEAKALIDALGGEL